ncbi:HEAT repeat domain-containing protein [Dictyobacter aurantiacus]|uniref:Uncharacterized protein n=1 Tax=Dictyobacter aurantiacus TaxID=1936993 RepID=A0A401ZF11_9CHLR|nr:HEAT repeat domain-containing protein [Dictyobacter aurantiacus]GCE05426.1 hypothetical protein KDAU_27550 [Dictyobacter aurantiacus]
MNSHNSSDWQHEHQRHPVWDDEVSVPPSLLSGVLNRLDLDQQQTRPAQRSKVLKNLSHPDWYVRAAAVQEVGGWGDPTFMKLLEQVAGDEHVSVRAAAIYALGRIKMDLSMPLLVQALHDPEWQVREKAVLALTEQGSQASLEFIQMALYDPDNTVREAASYALQRLEAEASTASLSSAVTLSLASEGSEEHAPLHQTIVKSSGWLAQKLFGFWPGWRRSQHIQGEHMKQQTPFIPEPHLLPRNVVRQPRPRRRAIMTGLVFAVVIVVVFAWVVLLQQRQLTGSETAHGGHPGSVATQVATRLPSPSPTPASNRKVSTVYTYDSPYRSVFSVAWSPDGKRIVMVDNTIKSWDATTGKNTITYANSPAGDVTAVAWSPDGRFIVGSGANAQLWDANSGQSLGVYTPQIQAGQTPSANDLIYDSSWSPDGSLIASAANGKAYGFSVQVWNPQTRQIVFSIPSNPVSYIRHVRWSPDGKYLAFDDDGKVLVYSVATHKLVSQNTGSVFAWSPDGEKIISADDNHGTMLIWQSTTGQTLSTLQYQDPSHGLVGATALIWSVDGRHIALAAGSLTEWDVVLGKKVAEYTGHIVGGGREITSLAWSPDGKMIVSADGGEGGQATAQVWTSV